jgi:hypothetical protein
MIRILAGVTLTADAEAVEEMMRTAYGALDGLSESEFAEEARQCWVAVRASRLIDVAGVTGAAALDPGLHTAACVHVHTGADGPLTRPLTFRDTDAERPVERVLGDLPGHPEWVTYAIPAADWRADMTRAQASAHDRGCPFPMADGFHPEAICRRCGEVFNPDLHYPDGTGIEHYETAYGTECGGRGDLCGWWG